MVRRQRIRGLAEELLKRYSLKAPPICVDQIAKNEGAIVLYEELEEDVSGFLYRENDTVVIGVNRAKGPKRNRFTVAHELGHLLLGHPSQVHVDRTTGAFRFRDRLSEAGTDDHEVEANAFAAELLMPRAFLLKEFEKKGHSRFEEDTIADLAETYGVSEQAMTIRLGNLGLLRF